MGSSYDSDKEEGNEIRSPPPPPPPSNDVFKDRFEIAVALGQKVMNSLPPEPEKPIEKMMYFFMYAVQYIVLFNQFNGDIPKIDWMNDTRDEIVEKSYYMHLQSSYRVFTAKVDEYARVIHDLMIDNLLRRVEPDHPLVFFLRELPKHKELFSRRIKADPAASRTKTDVSGTTFNAVTKEEYNPQNPNHKWHMLILHPLPSDYDPQAKDPKEGGLGHSLAIEVDKLNGKHAVPEAFYIAVTPGWDTGIRMVHTLLHFTDYMNMYLIGTLPVDEDLRALKWEDMWSRVFGDYATVNVEKLSREKKKTPLIVSRTAELRDLLKEAVLLRESLTLH